jgi:nitrogen fixation protein FixH
MSIQKSPIMVLMFVLFIALVGATVWRIMTALETHPGLVVADAYETGERYGETLKNRAALAKQGWTLELIVPKTPTHNVKQTYTAISQKHEKSYNKANATAFFYRPLEMQHDFSRPMIRKSDGSYEVEVSLPLKGRWDLLVEISKGHFLQQNSARLFAQ